MKNKFAVPLILVLLAFTSTANAQQQPFPSGQGKPNGSPGQTQIYDNGGNFGGAGCQTFANKDTGPQNNDCDTHFKGPNPWIDATRFGARPLQFVPNTITVITNGTSTVTTTGISDFQVGDGLVIGAGAGTTSMTTPAAPTAAVIGANGSSTINYQCVGVDAQWGLSAASASGTVTTVPQVFGNAATHISSATWAANVVTVNTSTAMPFSSGTLHVMVANIVSGGNQIGGIRNATVVNSTQLTYSLTGSGAVSTFSDSNVLFVNGFILTQVSETAGSNVITLTTDTNHNFQQQLTNQRPTKVYIEGISFPGELQPGYANGPFTILSTTSNTITIQTPFMAAITQNAVASFTLTTSRVNPAQMTALVYPEVLVTCPQNADGTPSNGASYYAVYANYGGGFAPIGFTLWKHSILMDMGPAYTQAGFVPPSAMNLPATPPGAAQKQVFEGQISSINGNTLTLDRAVPQSLTSVTGYHSNGIALQNAINASCQATGGGNGAYAWPVLFPRLGNPVAGGYTYYVFNAPVDMGAGGSNTCNRISIIDDADFAVNGTIFASSGAYIEIKKSDSGYSVGPSGNVSGGLINWIGYADPQLAPTHAARITGIGFQVYSNGQTAVVSSSENSDFEDDSFSCNGALPTAIPLAIGGGFQIHLRNISFGCLVNPSAPQPVVCSPNGNCGQLMWWPIPAIEIVAVNSLFPGVVLWDGINYGNQTGLLYTNLYPGALANPFNLEVTNVQTFQLPWQPLVTIEGNVQLFQLNMQNTQMDSLDMPSAANIGCGNCGQVFMNQAYTANRNSGTSSITGTPFRTVFEFGQNLSQIPASNSNGTFINATGFNTSQPIYATNAVLTTPSVYENCNRANGAIGPNWTNVAGSGFSCNSNQISSTGAGTDNISFYNNGVPVRVVGINQFSQVTIPIIGGRSGPVVFANPDPGSVGGYACTETSVSLTISIFSNAGIITNLATVGISGVNGDRVRLEAIRGQYGPATTTLNCYLNSAPPSSPTLTTTDNTFATGFPGLTIDDVTVRADNWSGGYLQTIAQTTLEQDWTQPQHFTQPVTIGPTNPVAGALAANTLYSSLYATQTNCSSSAAPAVCGSAAAGSVVIAAGATTVTVNTSAVTANSQIMLTNDDSLGTKLGVTCNTTINLEWVSARTAGTSFVITTAVAPTTNPECLSYSILN